MEESIEEELRASLLTKSHEKMGFNSSQLGQSSKSWQNEFNTVRGSGT